MVAFDIETCRNEEMIDKLPEPKQDSRLKDPDKIKADLKAKKDSQIENMALDPFFSRVCTYAFFNGHTSKVVCLSELSDKAEKVMLEEMFEFMCSDPTIRGICTWNGYGFDIPFIYKRALVLGIKTPVPKTFWGKRYSNTPHCDLMQEISGWSNEYAKLDTYAKLLLNDCKIDMDVTKNHELVQDNKGHLLSERCLQDAKLTYKLFEKFNNVIF